jgi:catechol 2,3-dioxygenase-like lactoylglutathione lyase family enzyme
MMIRKLEHYNIRTTRFEDTVRFYVQVLGMRNDRAPMAAPGFPATWIFDASGTAVVHLLPIDPADSENSYAKMSQYRGRAEFLDPPTFRGSGAIDHVAFECEGYGEILSRLQSAQVPYAETHFPEANMRQIFVADPNGITLELNFRERRG